MSNEIISVIIGGSLALSGVLLSSFFQVISSVLQRKWNLQDRLRERQIQVLDRRIDQIEQFLESMTQDFRLIYHLIEFYLDNDDPYEAKQQSKNRQKYKENLDTTIFAKGAAIRSLHDEKVNNLWESMMDASDKINNSYAEIYHLKYKEGVKMNVEAFRMDIMNTWLQYSGNLVEIYTRLDEIRKSVA